MPSMAVLDLFGAKDVVAIALGDWWRLITPMFIHIGLLHFAFNSYALFVIGPQIEAVFGARWFLLIYILAGVFGNVCSALYSISISAGASGAIVGLLGSGLFLEQSIRRRVENRTGHRPRAGAYLINTLMMVGLGVLIPNIDNAAHFGGLFAGYIAAAGILRIRANQIFAPNPSLGMSALVFVAVLGVLGSMNASRPEWVGQRFLKSLAETNDVGERLYLSTRAIDLRYEVREFRYVQAESLILLGEMIDGVRLLLSIPRLHDFESRIDSLTQTLESTGRQRDSRIISAAVAKHGV